jgi:GTP cyclohydrolase I
MSDEPTPSADLVRTADAAGAIEGFLRALGFDPEHPELRGTGHRVAEAFIEELCAGYAHDPNAILKSAVLPSSSRTLVCVRDLPVSTTCPHHLMVAWGRATVAYQPNGTIVGLGALGEAIDACARRLTLQETIGERFVDALVSAVQPSWALCRITLEHGCMLTREGRRHGARVETTSLFGIDDTRAAQWIGETR